MLSEDGAKTVHRLVKSTITVVEEISSYLIDLWQRRRADTSMLEQPTEQWWELVPSRSPPSPATTPARSRSATLGSST
jgi:hypothetical protein